MRRRYIYTLSFENNDVFYVGVADDLNKRLSGHMSQLKFFIGDRRVYIEEVENIFGTKEEISKSECYWINQFKAWGFALVNNHFLAKSKNISRSRTNISISNDLNKILDVHLATEGRKKYRFVESALREKLDKEYKKEKKK